MSQGDYAKDVAQLLAKASDADAMESTALSQTAADALVAAMQAAMRESSVRARRVRWMRISAMAASVPIVALGAWLSFGAMRGEDVVEIRLAALQGEAAVMDADGASNALAGSRLRAGAEIHSRAGVDLALSTGTRLHLSGDTRFGVLEQSQTQRFRLRTGAVFAHVAKLHHGERFLIETHDTTVEVRGTSFEVSLVKDEGCKDGLATRVRVEEGVVSVVSGGHASRVHRGESWVAPCATQAPAKPVAPLAPVALPAATAATTEASPPPAPPIARPLRQGVPVRAPSSSLAESEFVQSSLAIQNDSFAEAIGLRRSGDLRAAGAKFDAFLQSYPSSPLRESVMIERMKVLAAMEDPSAQRAAQDYLEAYPDGLGRSVAHSLLGDE